MRFLRATGDLTIVTMMVCFGAISQPVALGDEPSNEQLRSDELDPDRVLGPLVPMAARSSHTRPAAPDVVGVYGFDPARPIAATNDAVAPLFTEQRACSDEIDYWARWLFVEHELDAAHDSEDPHLNPPVRLLAAIGQYELAAFLAERAIDPQSRCDALLVVADAASKNGDKQDAIQLLAATRQLRAAADLQPTTEQERCEALVCIRAGAHREAFEVAATMLAAQDQRSIWQALEQLSDECSNPDLFELTSTRSHKHSGLLPEAYLAMSPDQIKKLSATPTGPRAMANLYRRIGQQLLIAARAGDFAQADELITVLRSVVEHSRGTDAQGLMKNLERQGEDNLKRSMLSAALAHRRWDIVQRMWLSNADSYPADEWLSTDVASIAWHAATLGNPQLAKDILDRHAESLERLDRDLYPIFSSLLVSSIRAEYEPGERDAIDRLRSFHEAMPELRSYCNYTGFALAFVEAGRSDEVDAILNRLSPERGARDDGRWQSQREKLAKLLEWVASDPTVYAPKGAKNPVPIDDARQRIVDGFDERRHSYRQQLEAGKITESMYEFLMHSLNKGEAETLKNYKTRDEQVSDEIERRKTELLSQLRDGEITEHGFRIIMKELQAAERQQHGGPSAWIDSVINAARDSQVDGRLTRRLVAARLAAAGDWKTLVQFLTDDTAPVVLSPHLGASEFVRQTVMPLDDSGKIRARRRISEMIDAIAALEIREKAYPIYVGEPIVPAADGLSLGLVTERQLETWIER